MNKYSKNAPLKQKNKFFLYWRRDLFSNFGLKEIKIKIKTKTGDSCLDDLITLLACDTLLWLFSQPNRRHSDTYK